MDDMCNQPGAHADIPAQLCSKQVIKSVPQKHNMKGQLGRLTLQGQTCSSAAHTVWEWVTWVPAHPDHAASWGSATG